MCHSCGMSSCGGRTRRQWQLTSDDFLVAFPVDPKTTGDDSTQKNVVKNNIHSVKLKLMKMCGWKTIFLLQRQLGATVVLIRQVPSGKLR